MPSARLQFLTFVIDLYVCGEPFEGHILWAYQTCKAPQTYSCVSALFTSNCS